LVDLKKERPELGRERQIVIHFEDSGVLAHSTEFTLEKPDRVIRIFEGLFLTASKKLLRNRGFHVDYLGHAHQH